MDNDVQAENDALIKALDKEEERVFELMEALQEWKEWHRKIADAINSPFVERDVTLETAKKLGLKLAGLDHRRSQVDRLIEFFLEFREQFDGSEYQQGKKDGMRIALTFIDDPGWARTINPPADTE